MQRDIPRWFLLIAVAACIVAMIVWARGPAHHHGRYVGSLGAVHVSVIALVSA